LLSNADPEVQREAITGLVYTMIDFQKNDEQMIKRMFGEVTPKTAAESEALYQRFMKLFDDPDNFFSAYVADARDLGYVQSHFGRYFSCKGVDEAYKDRGGREAADRDLARHVINLNTIDIYKQGVNRLMDEIYRRGWFGKVLLAFVKEKSQNAVLMEIDNTISPDEVARVLKEAFLFDTDDELALDYQIGFGNSWAEAYCSVLDGIDEKLLLAFELMPWQHNIDAVVSSYKALNEDNKDDQNEITPSKETAPSKKEQNKKGQGNQNKKFKWFR
jgi:hypothetical protein